ncbi:MAG: prepilin-type N-terminal cleavage/methylation domain-containing protein [Patescibacteria group bacterium]
MRPIIHRVMHRKGSSGFTLIELLVVISIISLLSSIVLTSVNSARAKARDARRIADFKQIQTALELFYDSQGRYPQSPGHATWSGHWAYFSQCLETGTNCGFTTSGFVQVIPKVPQDPRRTVTDPFAEGVTYYPGYPTGCSDGQSYRIKAELETNSAVLASSIKGSFYNNNGGCNGQGYCVGVGTCGGW